MINNFPNGGITDASQVPDAIETYVKVLTAAEANSVTIASIGFPINIRDLIRHYPGLFAAKVKEEEEAVQREREQLELARVAEEKEREQAEAARQAAERALELDSSLTALAEQNDVLHAEQRVRQLRYDGIVVTHYARKEWLFVAQPGDQITAQLSFDG